MAKTRWKLTDERWEKIAALLPKSKIGKEGGRPRADNRKVFAGILGVLRIGAPWGELPKEYGSASTCWRTLLSELDNNEQLDWSEAFVDGSFAPAKKGALASERPKKAKARSGWWWSMAQEDLWGITWTLRAPAKSSSLKRR